jgi:prepilin-type N-terminal cleavage/methylation domain-containing protein
MILEIGKIKTKGYNSLIKKTAGFSLIEMLTVVIIISILFVATVPSIGKTARNFYFTNKAKQLKAMMIFIKKTASLENRKKKLLLDFQSDTYSVLSETDESGYDVFNPPEDLFLSKQILSEGLDLQGESEFSQNLELIFMPIGSISSSNFYLKDNFDHKARFTTTLSGQIELEFN